MLSKENIEDADTKFLLQELSQLEAERLRLKAEAGQRLNFFLSLTSAILGGIVIFGQSANSASTEYILLAALVFLTSIGWQTFDYIVGRDISTDFTVRASGRIRRYFTDRNPLLRAYVTFIDDDEPTKFITRNASSIRLTSQLTLTFLIASSIGLFIYLITQYIIGPFLIGMVSFPVFLLILESYAQRRFRKAVNKARGEMAHPRKDRLPSKKYLPNNAISDLESRNSSDNKVLEILLSRNDDDKDHD